MGSIKSIHTDVLAMYGNEAGLAYLVNPSFYVSAERRFNNSGLNFYSAVAATPTDWGTFGLILATYGFELYREHFIGAAYGKKLSSILAIGAQFDYLQVNIPSYGKKSTATAEIGVLAKVARQVQVGFHVYNPFDIRLTDEQSLPSSFTLGIRYESNDQVKVMAEIEKITGQKENIKGAVSYLVLDQLDLRLGINTHPSQITFGVGYQLSNGFSADIGSTVHQQLGISPMGGIGFQRTKSL